LRVAYRDLQDIARDPREPAVRRSQARAAGVLVHRLILLITTGADTEVEAELYLGDTLDTAARTSRALLDNPRQELSMTTTAEEQEAN